MAERPARVRPELQALLQAYRATHAMPKAAKRRVHARLQEDTAPRVRRMWPWALGALAAGLLVWGIVSVRGVRRSSTEQSPGSQAAMQARDSDTDAATVAPQPTVPRARTRLPTPSSTPVAPLPAPEETLDAPEPETRTTPPRRPPAPKRVVPPTEPETQASRLGAENRLISRTWQLVRAKQFDRASATLAEHAGTFPDGVLAPERRALEVIVDCLAHPDAAAGKAEAYARSGRTTLLANIRSACKEEKTQSK